MSIDKHQGRQVRVATDDGPRIAEGQEEAADREKNDRWTMRCDDAQGQAVDGRPGRRAHLEFRAMVEPALLMAGLAPDTRSMWLPYRADVYLRGGLRLRIGRLTQLGSKSDGWRVCVTEGARQSRPWAPSWVDDTDGSPAALVELLRAIALDRRHPRLTDAVLDAVEHQAPVGRPARSPAAEVGPRADRSLVGGQPAGQVIDGHRAATRLSTKRLGCGWSARR